MEQTKLTQTARNAATEHVTKGVVAGILQAIGPLLWPTLAGVILTIFGIARLLWDPIDLLYVSLLVVQGEVWRRYRKESAELNGLRAASTKRISTGRIVTSSDLPSLGDWIEELRWTEYDGIRWRLTMPYALNESIGHAWLPEASNVDIDTTPYCPKCDTELVEKHVHGQSWMLRRCVSCEWTSAAKQTFGDLWSEAGKKARSEYRKYLKNHNLTEGVS